MTNHGSLCEGPLAEIRSRILVLTVVLVLGAVGTASGAKPICADVPISVTFVATNAAPATITNDMPVVYQDGVNGVFNAAIHYNSDCNGTRDATFGLNRSKRTVSMQFPDPISGSILVGGPPSFAGGSAFAAQPFVNIRNIVGFNTPGLTPSSGSTQGVAATYYAKVSINYIVGPDGNSYALVFFPDNATCPAVCAATNDGGSLDNSPVADAWTQVTYTPRNVSQPWSPTNADSWIVDGEGTSNEPPAPFTTYERGTLFLQGRKGSTHFGQYSMPFKIVVTALAPLP